MRLGIVLEKIEVILLAKFTNLLGVSTTAIEVYNHYRLATRSNGSLNLVRINLQRIFTRLHGNSLYTILGNAKRCCNESVRRNNDFFTFLDSANLFICTYYPNKCIKAISHTDAMFGANILGVLFLEGLQCLTLKVPATIYYSIYCLMDFFCI